MTALTELLLLLLLFSAVHTQVCRGDGSGGSNSNSNASNEVAPKGSPEEKRPK